MVDRTMATGLAVAPRVARGGVRAAAAVAPTAAAARSPLMRAARGLALASLLPAGILAVLAGEALVAGRQASRRMIRPPDGPIDEIVGSELPGKPLQLGVFGDSTVAGAGSPTEEGTLAVQVASQLSQELGRPVHVRGRGVIGARAEDVVERQLPAAAAAGEHFDQVLLVVGGNDVTHFTRLGPFADDTRAMVDQARRLSDRQVVLAGAPRFFDAKGIAQPLRGVLDHRSVRLERRQEEVARSAGARYVDIATESSVRYAGRRDSVSADGFHPSVVGYRMWADAIAPELAQAARASD